MKMNVNEQALFQWLQKEANTPFSGWDFDHLYKLGRMKEAPLRWNYANRVLASLSQADSLLDMGTGGGEFLGMLAPLPSDTWATEGYGPNVEVARARLEPLGVTVIEADEEGDLPFADQSLQLIINRHSAYKPTELRRMLKPGGLFITQQVGGENDTSLNSLLGAPSYDEYVHWNLAYATQELAAAGLTIREQKEEISHTRFYDVGAIVYYLSAIPWQIADFSVERYFDALVRVHRDIELTGYVDVACHRFLIVAESV